MKYRWAVIFFIAAFALQTAWMGAFSISDVSANLILCVSAAIAFTYPDDTSGIVLGGIFSLIYDAVFSAYLGITAFPLVITIALVMFVKEKLLNNENRISMLIVSAGSVLVYYNLYWLAVRAAGYNSAYTMMLGNLIWYLILNMVVMLILYFFLIRRVVIHQEERYNRWVR